MMPTIGCGYCCRGCGYVLGYTSGGMLLRPVLRLTVEGSILRDWERFTATKRLYCPECGRARLWVPLGTTEAAPAIAQPTA